MWEYWDFEFRNLELTPGWEDDEWNYDRFIVADQHLLTHDQDSFSRVLADWVKNSESLTHMSESACPE
jgi:hypothetical protein